MAFLKPFVLLLLVSLTRAMTLKSQNPSFEQNPSGMPSGPGGRFWSLRQVVGRPPNTLPPIQFLRNAQRARTGTGYAVLNLWAGAVFPSFVRLGQPVRLQKQYLYRVQMWVRVDSGTVIGGTEGAIVSTFCEETNGGGFIGKDSNLDAVSGFIKGDYSRLSFDIVGDGGVWDCTVALLGQPTLVPLEVRMSVDDFRITELRALPNRNLRGNVLKDSGFSGPLAPPNYTPDGQIELLTDEWQKDFFIGVADEPFLRGSGGQRALVCQLPPIRSREILEFTGVVHRVSLVAGQRYELSIQYTREEPRQKPAGVAVTIFNYYVRLPGGAGGLVRQTEGLLLGAVDVRVGDNPTGTSAIRFTAPVRGTYEVVLKLSAYGNEGIPGVYRMSFDNARLTRIPS